METWLKSIILFLLFGFLAIFQISFLVHFNIIGTTPNLIFILFFLAVFFSGRDKSTPRFKTAFFSALFAGLFLDIFYFSYFGLAIILLLIMAYILKYILFLLKKTRDEYPIVYFAPLFILFFIFFNIFLTTSIPILNWVFLVEIIYNLIFALLGFYIFKTLKLYEF